MKFLLYLFIFFALLINGCKKPDDSSTAPTVNPPLSQPSSDSEIGPGRTGSIPLSKEEYNAQDLYVVDPKLVNLKGGRQIAKQVDLSIDMPMPENQGQENSCVGWATAYAARSYLYHIDNKTVYYPSKGVRDNKVVFSPRFVYNSLLKAAGDKEDVGSKLREGLKLLYTQGVCTWEDMPYKAKEHQAVITPTQLQKAANYKIKSYLELPVALPVYNSSNIVDFIKQFIQVRSVPVLIGMIIDDGFINPKSNIGNGYEMIGNEVTWKRIGKVSPVSSDNPSSKTDPPSHAITIVGYDDDKHAFKLMNSYGSKWGNNGFIWMDYDLFSANTNFLGKTYKVVNEAYVAVGSLDGLSPAPVVTPTGSIDVSFVCNNLVKLKQGENPLFYYYEMVVNTSQEYNVDEMNLHLILPDKQSFYTLSPEVVIHDGLEVTYSKTFTFKFYYAPNGKYWLYINNESHISPYYIAYSTANFPDPKSLPAGESYSDTKYLTPTGAYEFAISNRKVYKANPYVSTYTTSKRVVFPQAFFDLKNCINTTDAPLPPVKLFSVNF